MIWGDFHIHTSFSGPIHAKGTAEEITAQAKKVGLKQIGLTDHGLRHVCFGTSRKKLCKLRRQVDAINGKQSDVEVLLGIEANIFSSDGLVDLINFDRSTLDFVIVGFHKMVWSKNFADAFRFNIPAFFRNFSASMVKTYTKAYVNMIKTQKPDILAHLGYAMPVDVKEVGKAAADYGVLIELNGKHVGSLSDQQINTLKDCGVTFVLNSDAHSPERVGDVALPLKTVERLGIDYSRIANMDKPVVFKKG